MKYAQIDQTGKPIAFYDDVIHKTIPQDAIVIPDIDWQEHISGNEKVWDGTSWIKYVPPPPPPIPFPEYQSLAKKQVIDYALSIEKELTADYTPGEVASWPAKLEAAYAYLDQKAKPAQVVLIETEANEKGITTTELCNVIITKGEWYSEATALIASLRSKTYNAIDNATTEEEINTILNNALIYANERWVDLISRMP